MKIRIVMETYWFLEEFVNNEISTSNLIMDRIPKRESGNYWSQSRALCHELIIFMTSSLIWRALTKSLGYSEHNMMLLPSTLTPFKPKPLSPCCLLVYRLTCHSHDPTASLASYLWRKSYAYMHPWPLASLLGDHVTCHLWHSKE